MLVARRPVPIRCRVLAVFAVFVLGGCGHDLEDLYGPMPSSSAMTSPNASPSDAAVADATVADQQALEVDADVLLPEHGRLAFTDRAACTACFRGECAQEQASCADDPACRGVQACLAACQDPACNWRCFGEQDQMAPDRENGTLYHPQYEALKRCRDTACAEACEFAVDRYGCVGEYDRRSVAVEAEEDLVSFPTNLVDGVGQPVPGATIMLCSQAQTDCALPLAMTETGADGRATVGYSVTATVAGTFGLYMDAPAVPDGVLGTLLYPPDGLFTPGVRYGMQNFTRAQAEALELLPGIKAWPSFALGAIAIVAFDCAAGSAVGLELEVEAAGEIARIVYPGSQQAATGVAGFAIAQAVEPGLKTYWLRRADTGALLRREQVLVRPATLTIVWTSPPDEAPLE